MERTGELGLPASDGLSLAPFSVPNAANNRWISDFSADFRMEVGQKTPSLAFALRAFAAQSRCRYV
eukprot:scaffold7586_cov315-Pinguiococcus_pyrenoidosus.AAC.1